MHPLGFCILFIALTQRAPLWGAFFVVADKGKGRRCSKEKKGKNKIAKIA
jgi:hypothetical protein